MSTFSTSVDIILGVRPVDETEWPNYLGPGPGKDETGGLIVKVGMLAQRAHLESATRGADKAR